MIIYRFGGSAFRRRVGPFLAGGDKVNVIGDQGPCKTIGLRLSQHLPQPLYKGITIGIVSKNFPAFDSAHYDMVQRTCSINSGFSWHVCSNS
jgi:hypothetical protein